MSKQTAMKLKLEVNANLLPSKDTIKFGNTTILFTPAIGKDYWLFRVKVHEKQAILGFPKFGVIGVGFAIEEDWNTNLPSRVPAERIYSHIKHNKGWDEIPDERCIEAIRMIQKIANQIPKEN